MKIKEYIESGALEAFVLGAAGDDEIRELMLLKKQYPEIERALADLEADMERIAQYTAVPPPPDMFARIEDRINDVVIAPESALVHSIEKGQQAGRNTSENKSRYIEVEAESNYMRVHKHWKWVFVAAFVLGKIFLVAALYFYFENRQARQQVQELKAETKQFKTP